MTSLSQLSPFAPRKDLPASALIPSARAASTRIADKRTVPRRSDPLSPRNEIC